jgi:hypothetical protein
LLAYVVLLRPLHGCEARPEGRHRR